MSLRLILSVAVFFIDVWAIVRVLEQPWPRRARIGWVALVVGLPGLGAGLWWRKQRRLRTSSTFASPDLPSAPRR